MAFSSVKKSRLLWWHFLVPRLFPHRCRLEWSLWRRRKEEEESFGGKRRRVASKRQRGWISLFALLVVGFPPQLFSKRNKLSHSHLFKKAKVTKKCAFLSLQIRRKKPNQNVPKREKENGFCLPLFNLKRAENPLFRFFPYSLFANSGGTT